MALAAVGLLIGRIVSALESEASLIGGVRDELNQLKLEFASMRSFLEDADKTTVQTEGGKTWVANVRDLAYEVEDIIDEYMYYMNKQKVHGKFTRFLRQIVYAPKNLWVRHRIATKLQKINSMIKAIPERSRRYGVDGVGEASSSSSSSSQDHQRRLPNLSESSLFFKDDDLVGIEDGKKQLLDWLTDKKESQRTVISVVGMGGSGKTTLVAQAYNSQIVKRQFDCYAWITVSQTYVVNDLLRSMIKEFYGGAKEAIPMDLSSMSYRELIQMITDFLRLKRYVIVFDDVWSSNLWRDIHVSLLDEGLGSRVILTTRNEEIASSSFGVKSYVHYIKLLGVSDAWNLFCMKAFSSNPNRCCPQHLKTLAQDLVAKCKGLPLAIVALGGVMPSKYLELEWRKIYNSLSWELSNNPGLEVVKTILLLSFNDLPYRLKCCFLYCCLFPEDYKIKRKRLIRLWMAEGFVEKVRGRTPEEVAESYLMELICRSMLQVVMRNELGRPKNCKMHDLMRELAISTSETEKFCVVYDGREANDEEGSVTNRRMSIQSIGRELQPWNWKGMLKLRTLLVFVVGEIALPLELRLLRVLDLENAWIEVLPEELADLFNLRYLNLRGSRVKELPKSIGRLCNLNTLDITDSKIEVLPAGITELRNLRHLKMYHFDYELLDDFQFVRGTTTPSNICKLKNMQVLAGVEAQADLMKRIKNMTQLKRIGITKVREVDEEDLCTAIQNMSLLHRLSVKVIDEDEYLRMDALSSTPPRHLKVLILAGKLEKVPCWFHSLQNLTFLSLRWSRLTEDPIPYIQALPNLGRLHLFNAYEGGGQLCFSEGFHKLRKLELCNFPQLNEIVIERGVMPGLQEFSIRKCMQLKILPHGIEYLEDLQGLFLTFVTNELIECIRGEGSKDHQKVRHIPSIHHWRQTPVELKYELLSRSTDRLLQHIRQGVLPLSTYNISAGNPTAPTSGPKLRR
ncbi:disease resistance protein RPM1-like [Camellia sinensis]|uniref:disease resistance protein RPM1-like n=1 Tax=Camellia sinensis TaxID=4442 RepID=UPI0010368631|nr:disease resistance protein RPM1-like [Camellia sinensis]